MPFVIASVLASAQPSPFQDIYDSLFDVGPIDEVGIVFNSETGAVLVESYNNDTREVTVLRSGTLVEAGDRVPVSIEFTEEQMHEAGISVFRMYDQAGLLFVDGANTDGVPVVVRIVEDQLDEAHGGDNVTVLVITARTNTLAEALGLLQQLEAVSARSRLMLDAVPSKPVVASREMNASLLQTRPDCWQLCDDQYDAATSSCVGTKNHEYNLCFNELGICYGSASAAAGSGAALCILALAGYPLCIAGVAAAYAVSQATCSGLWVLCEDSADEVYSSCISTAVSDRNFCRERCECYNWSSGDWYPDSTCCTPEYPCTEGNGDCDGDDECAGNGLCGYNNCGALNTPPVGQWPATYDCCMDAEDVVCDDTESPFWDADVGCCTSQNPCTEGNGDCDSDSGCAGSLVCGYNACNYMSNRVADGDRWNSDWDCCMESCTVLEDQSVIWDTAVWTYQTRHNITEDACCAHCRSDPECVAAVWDRDDGYCYPMSGHGGFETDLSRVVFVP